MAHFHFTKTPYLWEARVFKSCKIADERQWLLCFSVEAMKELFLLYNVRQTESGDESETKGMKLTVYGSKFKFSLAFA